MQFFSLLFFIPLFLFGNEMITVDLPLDHPLMPLYLSSITAEKTDLTADYLQKLDQVLRFDLGHNGMTEPFMANSKLERLASPSQWNSSVAIKEWKANGILYVISAKVQGNKGSFTLLSTGNMGVKSLDDVALTGNLSQDRQTLHKIADTIHATLFGTEGIASRRFIFTRKTRDAKGSTRSYLVEADWDGENQKILLNSPHLIVTPFLVPASSGHFPKSCLYVSYELGQPKIFLATLDGKGSNRLTYLKGNQLTPSISQGRDKIAFINDSLGNPDLFLMEINEGAAAQEAPRRIFQFPGATNASPAFSPDGKTIAFVSSKDGSTRIYLLKIPEKGASLKDVKAQLLTTQQKEASAPAWSPDGTRVAFCAKNGETHRQIWVYDLQKKTEKQLTFGPGDKENPTWAANSLHLIFNVRQNDETSDLYLMNLHQSNTVPIVVGGGQNRFPSW